MHIRFRHYSVSVRVCGYYKLLSDFQSIDNLIIQIKANNKLRGLSPLANYTDRATAACRRSHCQLFADRGCHVVGVTDPYGRIIGFLDRSLYFSIK
jgi:hypothetical protein